MSFYINNNLYFDFYINDIQLPLTVVNINSLLINYNIYDLLPVIRLEIFDDKNMFNQGLLQDGSLLAVAIGRNLEESQKNVYEFQLVGVPEDKRSTSYGTYLIYGVLHIPHLWKCVEPISITGTSNYALNKLAIDNGLKYDGCYTNDNMTWLNGLNSHAQFIKNICKYGYSNPYSCMLSAISLDKTLIYKNINDLKQKYQFSNENQENKNSFKYNDIKLTNNASIYNYLYGYKNEVINYNINNSIKDINSIDVLKLNSKYLNINSKIYNESGIIRKEILSPNIGNVHSHWEDAYYQNKKYKAMNSIKADVFFDHATNVEILNKVKLSLINSNTNENDQQQASYWVIESKSLGISKQHYVEKFTISTTGVNYDLFGLLF